MMQISDIAKKDLSWWLENVDHDPCPIMPTEPSVTLKYDSHKRDGEVSLIILPLLLMADGLPKRVHIT